MPATGTSQPAARPPPGRARTCTVLLVKSSWWPGAPSMVGHTGDPATVTVREGEAATEDGGAAPAGQGCREWQRVRDGFNSAPCTMLHIVGNGCRGLEGTAGLGQAGWPPNPSTDTHPPCSRMRLKARLLSADR